MNFIGFIPARYGSTRFPGKPLHVIEGKSMIQRVYEQCAKSKVLSALAVATDDERIFKHVISFGGKAIMTKSEHKCGTERCHEAFQILKSENKFSDNDVVINIQGDEPLINPEQINLVSSLFARKEVHIATLIRKLESETDLKSNTVIKVVIDKNKKALYFSRAAIPYLAGNSENKNISENNFFMHIGIYAYRASVLNEIVKLQQSSLEKAESLEQLRWLENGFPIHVEFTKYESHSVDIPSDIDKIIKLLKEK
ncbi:MAG TPA: 3-deoxy-manno-octulosonate cytidylyltransferase [Bacteroidales bacterium]|nr:3-deoxy-manno-octulosonate cytidylyltransferase [Bacteroidales bacterium]HPS15801.1 3-deoxy-manno-octulosonate cytidylyltransferase [Bacteroidales bacterium]